jgi:hypothetical protein
MLRAKGYAAVIGLMAVVSYLYGGQRALGNVAVYVCVAARQYRFRYLSDDPQLNPGSERVLMSCFSLNRSSHEPSMYERMRSGADDMEIALSVVSPLFVCDIVNFAWFSLVVALLVMTKFPSVSKDIKLEHRIYIVDYPIKTFHIA